MTATTTSEVAATRRPWATAVAALRTVARVAGSGALAGVVVLGLGSRLAMRTVALASGERTTLTAAGTGFLLLAGLVAGSLVALLTVGVLGRWLPVSRTRRMAVTTVIAAALPAMAFLAPGNEDFALFGPRWVTVGLFTLVPLGYGWLLAVLDAGRARSGVEPSRGGRAVVGLVTVVAVVTILWRMATVATV